MGGKNSLHLWLLGLLLCFLVYEAAGLTEEKAIEEKFEELLNRYKELAKIAKDKNHPDRDKIQDCKILDSADDDHKHANRGTLSTLGFLLNDSVTYKPEDYPEEKHIDRAKLRKYLARVGYLQTPGSVILLDKFTSTLRLLGCKEKSMWVMQGENDEDDDFEGKVHTGESLKIPTPSSYSYIHKYTCYNFDSKTPCSHVFYVITKPFPELPLGLQVPEGKDSDEWEFTCSFPFCMLQDCEIPIKNIKYHRRIYAPYEMKWRVPKSLIPILHAWKPNDGYINALTSPSKFGDTNANIKFEWSNHVRKEKDSTQTKEKGFRTLDPSNKKDKSLLIDAFGEEIKLSTDRTQHTQWFFSRIVIKSADIKIHDGQYECIVVDANGVASVPPPPDVVSHQSYHGEANVHVMPSWQRWAPFVVAIICCVLVALIILICPKKMEYDDGTPYTKDELVAPGDIHTSAS